MKLAPPLLPILVAAAGCGSGGGSSPDANLPSLAGLPWSAPTVFDSKLFTMTSCFSVTDDGLDLYFLALNGGGDQIYGETRASTQDPWPSPGVAPLPADYTPGCPHVSPDGLTLYAKVSSVPIPDTGDAAVGLWTRPDRASAWQRSPGLYADDLQFAAYGASGPVEVPSQLAVTYDYANGHIYTATRPTLDDPWVPWMQVTSLDAAGFQVYPVMSPDQREIFSTTVGPGLCANDFSCSSIVTATRDDASQPFGAPQPLAVLAPGLQVSAPTLSSDGHTIYFLGRDANAAMAIYTATR